MDKTLTKADVIDFLKAGGKILGNLAMNVYGESLNLTGEKAFSEAIKIGIENTIAALYDAKVDDKEILRVVIEHWGITMQEAEDRLVWEKQQATIRSLQQYLRLKGYSANDIKNFIRENNVVGHIRHNSDLWKLKNSPEKLIKFIQSKDGGKQN